MDVWTYACSVRILVSTSRTSRIYLLDVDADEPAASICLGLLGLLAAVAILLHSWQNMAKFWNVCLAKLCSSPPWAVAEIQC